MFQFQRTTHVYETDLMGIVHHSNYLRFCEEARVVWCVQNKVLDASNRAVFGLTVVETRVKHIAPIRFGDELTILVQVKHEGARVIFQYRLQVKGSDVARAETIHCRIDENFKVLRLDKKMTDLLKEQKWTETWL